MGKKLEFTAEDPKAGMSLFELERAVEAANEAAASTASPSPAVIVPKVVVGFGGQIKKISVTVL